MSTVEADSQLRERPDDGLVKTVESGEVNGNFAIKQSVTHRSTTLATHNSLTEFLFLVRSLRAIMLVECLSNPEYDFLSSLT